MPVDRKALLARLVADISVAYKAEPGSFGKHMAAGLMSVVDGLANHIDALEKRLEQGPFKYMGPFTEGFDYEKGNFCTYQGCLWHANSATREKPGTGYEWTMAAKRGRDGKDMR